ncbi:MAG: uracil-DNA glycosylase [Clostridiales bacterium]|jgi:DNA polymerase|nr:uracil-DNA glycosylase [Eubacteriales bacterium]MDH7567142.1 uracil-DNA glycosylase [Clostridiales bacterium]
MSKIERLTALYEKYKKEFQGQEIVVGEGNPNTQLLLVGEAPGRDEVKLSKPFVGMAGRNLNEFLDIMEIRREAIYITNAVKYRLSKTNPQTGRVSNRPATKEDIEKNRQFLLDEIKIINSPYVVTLGAVPLKAITGRYDISIGTIHGELMDVDVGKNSFKLFPLYHPASIIYNRDLKDVYIRDVIRLKSLLI